MDRFLYCMAAGAAAALLVAGHAAAADPSPRNDETPARASENPGAERGAENHDSDPGAVKSVPDQAKQDKEYMAALKKCGALKGSEKQRCTESAERKFNRM